jgi:hypothetical protein
MKRIISAAITAIIISGCATITGGYPFTGNPGVDTALASDDYTPEEKKEILRKYYALTKSPNRTLDYRPVIDPAVCKNCNYTNDLAACNSIAAQNTNYAGNAAGSAAAGAATGAIFGAILGLDVGTLAAAGAAGGGIGGIGNEALTVRQMIVRCMQGRGYSVLR